MDLLKDKIVNEGTILGTDILKVDSFLNHQIDINLFNEIGKEFRRRFKDKPINKILTVEASGIGIACIVAQHFDNATVVFAKKHEATNLDKETYEAEVYSFTKNKYYKVRVAKQYINKEDNILIIDDFLANGYAATALIDVVKQGGAAVSGIGIVIEKAFQEGRKKIEELGIQLESLAIVEKLENGKIVFGK